MLTGHSATLWEGNIYLWGGKSDKSVSDAGMYNSNMYILSPQSCLSSPKTKLRKLHVTGSTQGGGSYYASSTVPKGRAYHSAVCYGRNLFITGGLSDTQFETSAEMEHYNSSLPVFDMERRTWSFRNTFGDIPAARCHHISVIYGDTLMLHGGYPILGSQRKELSPEEIAAMQHAMFDVHELHTLTLRWTRIHTTQSPSLWGHSAIVYNTDVIVFGGVDVVENAETGSIAVWSTARQRWAWVDSQNFDLRCTMHTAVQDGGRMLVFGGVSFRTKSKLRTLYEFNLDFGSWRELHPQGQGPEGRLGHAAVMCQQTLFIIGGSIKSDSGSGEVFERSVHMYNAARNTWTSCEISYAADTEVEELGEVQQDIGNQSSLQPSWIAAEDTQMARPQDQEWRGTAGSIRDTIARARAIQSLTSGAANALEKSLAGRATEASQDRSSAQYLSLNDPQTGQYGAHPGEASLQYQAPNHNHSHLVQTPRTQHGSTSNDQDTWKMIDHLKAENQQLRRELEDFRSTSMGGNSRNPYEVPVYNSQYSATLPADDRVAPNGMQSLRSLTQVIVPRLNINVADPPRILGNERNGHMSREAVTALINSSLRKDQPASLSLASRLARKDDNVSLDPMAYLHVTSNVARANASSGGIGGGGPLTYDQLLAKTAGGSHILSADGVGSVPTTLRPLLSLLASSSLGAPAPAYDQAREPTAGYSQPGQRPPPQQFQGPSASNSAQQDTRGTDARPKSASLTSIINGRSSMLSMGQLRGGK